MRNKKLYKYAGSDSKVYYITSPYTAKIYFKMHTPSEFTAMWIGMADSISREGLIRIGQGVYLKKQIDEDSV